MLNFVKVGQYGVRIIFMPAESPATYSYLFQEELYLLDKDRAAYSSPVNVPAATITAIETPQTVFKYFGANKKQLLVLVHYPDAEYMDIAHRAALDSTLKRLNIDPAEDAALLNMANCNAAITALKDYFRPSKILVHGMEALPGGLSPAFNQLCEIDGCRVLYTHSFRDMMNNNEYKKAFWEQIKQW